MRAQPTTPPTTPPAMPATLGLEEGDEEGVGELVLARRLVVALVKWVIWKREATAGELQFVDMLWHDYFESFYSGTEGCSNSLLRVILLDGFGLYIRGSGSSEFVCKAQSRHIENCKTLRKRIWGLRESGLIEL